MSGYMSKRNVFTTITPLPASLTRKTVIDFFRNHVAMIELNPLVIEKHPIKVPENASADETQCVWYSLTDKVHYLPGGMASGNVSYTACFNDLPNGVQTHCRAPAGVDIRSIWSLRGSLPGEPKEPLELGVTVPREGLYIREDVDLKCNFVLASFVKKTLKKAHSMLVEKLLVCAERKEIDQALSTQFPNKNPNIAAAHPATGAGKPLPDPNAANYRNSSDTLGSSSTANTQTPSAYSGHSGQYAYSDSANSQYAPSSLSSADPRMSYQSTQSWSGHHPLQAPGYQHAAPGYQQSAPGYQQGYNYGNQPGYPPQGYGYAQGGYDQKAWDPQNGWYQQNMEPVEIASSEVVLPSNKTPAVDAKKPSIADEKAKQEYTTYKKPQTEAEKKASDKGGYAAFAPPPRTHTYEME